MKKTQANVERWEYVRQLDALAIPAVEMVGVLEAYRDAVDRLDPKGVQHPRGNSAVRVVEGSGCGKQMDLVKHR